MAQIHVVFPNKVDGGDSPPPMVLNDPKPVMGGTFISWHVYCYNPEVEKVGIRFEEGNARYFNIRRRDQSQALEQTLEKTLLVRNGSGVEATNGPGQKGQYKAECVIWGQAPVHEESEYARSGAQNIVEKYTVFGLNSNGEEVASLDPEIINDKPRGGSGG